MIADDLVRNFYEWERRGRGWDVWPMYIAPEPAFVPFRGHYLTSKQVDDGRKPTFLSSLAKNVVESFKPKSIEAEVFEPEEMPEENEPSAIEPTADWCELRIILPQSADISKDSLEQLFVSLSLVRGIVSFEIIGTVDSISLQFAVSDVDESNVLQQLRIHLPGVIIERSEGRMNEAWQGVTSDESLVVDFGLSREFMLPLLMPRNLNPDPLTSLFGVMEGLQQNEVAVYQVILQPVREPWGASVVRVVTLPDGSPLFDGQPDFLAQARAKLSKPLFAAVLRVGVKAVEHWRVLDIARNITGAFSVFSNPSGNELIPLDNEGFDEKDRELEIACRATRRSGMILNLDELIALAHLPGSRLQSQKLERQTQKTKVVPSIAQNDGILLGFNIHKGARHEVRVGVGERLRHSHIIGASGTGKSTLMLNLILQDIENGEGIALLDPHGDLADAVLARIPENRIDDVIVFDPSDEQFSVGFNILKAHGDLERNLLSSDLVAVFKRLSTSWGDQMSSVLGNAILAFLESERGGTLLDLRRFLLETGYRNEFLKSVSDPEIVYYWQHHFPMLKGAPVASVLTRLDTFLRTKTIRYMVAQKDDHMDFAGMMAEGKILLAKLSQGLIGEENSFLLGSLLVSKFHQAAMSRQALLQKDRRPFFLYIDEFHNFTTPSMVSLLSGARKYALGLTLAHQELRQLERGDGELFSAVISNPYSRICFRVGDQDARKLESGFSYFDAKELQSLSTGEAICRIERADFDFNLETIPLSEIDEEEGELNASSITALSRQKYALSREEIEKILTASRQVVSPSATQSADVEDTLAVSEAIPATSVPVIEKSPAGPSVSSKKKKCEGILPETVSPGKGGQDHKYLQQLIRQWGQGMGYLATVEKSVLGGAGLVDVALEKIGRKLACEITVTTPIEYEIGNVRKCIEAGFDFVAVVAPDEKKLARAEKAMRSALSAAELEKTQFVTPDALFAFVESLEAQDAGKEATVRGYKVKVNYKTVDNSTKADHTSVISKVLAGSLKKMKE
ncbi:MAG: DUF87 domain-containing protein [Chthoniobacteraceae bacterium]